MPGIDDWTPTWEFEDGPGNAASGEQVMDNYRSLGEFLLGEIQGGAGMPLILKSTATDKQALTQSFEAMEDLDGDESELTEGLVAGQIYVVEAVVTFSRVNGDGNVEFQVKAGNDLIGESALPKAAEDFGIGEGHVNLGAIPVGELARVRARVGWFESDGMSPVKLFAKTTENDLNFHHLERGARTFVLLYPTQ